MKLSDLIIGSSVGVGGSTFAGGGGGGAFVVIFGTGVDWLVGVGKSVSREISFDDKSKVMSARLSSPSCFRPGRGLLRAGADNVGAASLTSSNRTSIITFYSAKIAEN